MTANHTKQVVSEKPISFSTEMVRAILEGQKTQTRRVVKAALLEKANKGLIFDGEWEQWCPYGKVGDRLWVREKFYLTYSIGHPFIIISYDYGENKITQANNVRKSNLKFHKDYSPTYMPRWASRITLTITDIRAERVQDISIEDIFKEGIDKNPDPMARPITSFAALWDSIYFKCGHGWENNPWVWVIKFKHEK